MQAHIARFAGFCAGVRQAFTIAEEAALDSAVWYTMGPLVHNVSVVDYFKDKGICPISALEEADEESGIIIRSHGVGPEIIQAAELKGIRIKDATCPRVKRIHELAVSLKNEGYELIIFGDPGHPEVQGIIGWAGGNATVVSDVHEAMQIQPVDKLGVVSQTTRDEQVFLEVVQALRSKAAEDFKVFNTICTATRKRQEAARELCALADLMLVVGDHGSSNTTTLVRECLNTGVKTCRIQSADEIQAEWLQGISRVGITAGASTPDWIIKEVVYRMTEFEEKDILEQNQEGEPVGTEEANEEIFARMEAEMAEYETPGRGDIIKGIVVQVRDDEVMVDVGGKSEGIIPFRELSLQDIDSAKEIVQVGDEIEVLVLKWDDDGTILLSKKKVDSRKVLDDLESAFNEGKTVQGTIIDSVKGGLLVDVGVTGFLPASHVEDGYVKNLDEYKDQTFEFKIIEFNRNKRRGSQVVLSRRELVLAQKEKQKHEFWDAIEEGQTRTGKVKRIVDYGAFIDLGGYEGLLHVSELDHRRIEHPSDILKEGDEIEIFILGVDHDKERVSLSRKKLLKSPWEVALETFNEGDIIEGTVVRIAPFGAFIQLDPGVDGLVHISQLADYRVEKPEDVVSVNQVVKVKILSIDPQEKRIGLSIREAQDDQKQQEVQEYMEQQQEQETEQE